MVLFKPNQTLSIFPVFICILLICASPFHGGFFPHALSYANIFMDLFIITFKSFPCHYAAELSVVYTLFTLVHCLHIDYFTFVYVKH